MVRMAGLEEKMLGWDEFRNPRERYAYPTPDQIRTMEFVEGRDGPAGLRGLETIGPFIPSEDNSKIVPLAETSGVGKITGMMDEIPGYMDPRTGQKIYPQEDWLSGGGTDVAGLGDLINKIQSGGSGGKLPTTKNKAGVTDAKYVEAGMMTPQEFIDKWGINPREYEDLPQAFASPNPGPRPVKPGEVPTDPSSPYGPPGRIDGVMFAHVNKTGTAHDWQDPNHGGIRVPGGAINPHGRRGGISWPDGRAKYSQEDLLRMMKDGSIDPNSFKWDDRFWPADTRPGDGSSMNPESQKLWDSIFSEDLNSGLGSGTEIAGNPSFDIDPSRSTLRRAKMFNKLKSNPSASEVEVIKRMLGGGLELPKV